MAKGSKIQQVKDLEERFLQGDTTSTNIVKYLTLVRDQKLRRSLEVSHYGKLILDAGLLLEEELWLVHEQVCTAALDCQDMALALKCIKKLRERFPNSIRVGRLRGMALESQGQFDDAVALYDRLIEKCTSPNANLIKRKIVCEKARGNTAAAIEALNEYLTNFMADVDAWAELGDLYIENEMYKQAAYCFEELVLAAPHNYLHHLKYAEILYTMPGSPPERADNLRTARKYYAAAVQLTDGKSVRALYGLWASCRELSELKSQLTPEDETELEELSAEQLIQMYENLCPSKVQFVKQMVAK
mmetsp:Transcript_9924/g.11491  ORF Transcript_9924/g.11491 Transcript_9924/m.11491 type:complete len:302 (-) Transcript_9924:660-1565(-)|eukprot:CAMPEP_0197852220 /NCGR_PEP_ID=MMETSP1438-20131217/19956_1 /TAXON_ID=1461541 /ORGANISM="Pterosperma sp., Strain CCMP1384" /LENGTH=301 /DNA_ID=CAMNT_0043466145 /DNA_START=127 /DNA_END=1032 /DNA_ORIENTATION=-